MKTILFLTATFVLFGTGVTALSATEPNGDQPRVIRFGARFENQADPLNQKILEIFNRELNGLPNFSVSNKDPDIVFAIYVDHNRTVDFMRTKVQQFKEVVKRTGGQFSEGKMGAVDAFVNGVAEEAARELRVVIFLLAKDGSFPTPHYINVGPIDEAQLEGVIKKLVEFSAQNVFDNL